MGTKGIHYNIPWVPEGFLACSGNFRCWPKADTSSAIGRSHERRSNRKKENKLASPEILSVASKTDEFMGICLIFIFRFCADGLNGEIGMYLV